MNVLDRPTVSRQSGIQSGIQKADLVSEVVSDQGAHVARATKWTDEKIKALKLPAGKAEQRVLVDAGLYLFLQQRASGDLSKQWQYRAQVDGVRRWLSLGACPGWAWPRPEQRC